MQNINYLVVGLNPTLQKTLEFPALIPDTVNRCSRHRLDTAGKGIDVCRVLTQLGKKCTCLTQLGGELRSLFLNLCGEDGLTVEWVESGSPIRFCYTLLNREQGSVTELVEEAEPVAAGVEEGIMAAYCKLLPDYRWVVISGSKARGFSDRLIPWMVREAKQKGKRVILDLRGKDLLNSLVYNPDVIKPNLFEFASTFAPELTVRNDIEGDEENVKSRVGEICRDFWAQYHTCIILTRGSRPVWYAEAGGLEEYSFEPVSPVVNTVGSGDAFTAGLAAALGDGACLKDAVARGVWCGGRNARFFRIGVIDGPTEDNLSVQP